MLLQLTARGPNTTRNRCQVWFLPELSSAEILGKEEALVLVLSLLSHLAGLEESDV